MSDIASKGLLPYKGLPWLLQAIDRWQNQEQLVFLHMKLFQAGLTNAETLVAEWGVLGQIDFSPSAKAIAIAETLRDHSIATCRGPEQYVLRAYFAFATHSGKVLREGESFHGQYTPYDRRDVYIFTANFFDYTEVSSPLRTTSLTAEPSPPEGMMMAMMRRHMEQVSQLVAKAMESVEKAEANQKESERILRELKTRLSRPKKRKKLLS